MKAEPESPESMQCGTCSVPYRRNLTPRIEVDLPPYLKLKWVPPPPPLALHPRISYRVGTPRVSILHSFHCQVSLFIYIHTIQFNFIYLPSFHFISFKFNSFGF
jgi:hypothetical protein